MDLLTNTQPAGVLETPRDSFPQGVWEEVEGLGTKVKHEAL